MSTTKREIATKIKDKIVKFETCQQQQNDSVKKRVSGVKEKIQLFEESKKSHGAIAKDKTSCDSHVANNEVVVRTSNPEPPRLPPDLTEIVELNAEIACKPLWKGREYLKQLSTEELINNLRIIEKLRDSYIEEIKETSAAAEGDLHDLEIHREEAASNPIDEEFGLSELHEDDDSYIVEAYNSAGNELVISQLQFDHHEEVATTDSLLINDDEVQFKNQWQRDSQYSSGGSSEDSTYMSLKDCLSGSTILYENTRAMKTMTTQNSKGKNLKIKIDVTLDGDDDEDEQKCAPSEK